MVKCLLTGAPTTSSLSKTSLHLVKGAGNVVRVGNAKRTNLISSTWRLTGRTDAVDVTEHGPLYQAMYITR
ncbi:unnamed protein product [Strongylus vulgaris]|uniref:Uncharacterized protein n=1 Tax=Strongylus vulgaris TaxID=40348 RepID=A0A3P7HYL7_STRVU|nr:unnamed protein product [Strongylus vulgaris]